MPVERVYSAAAPPEVSVIIPTWDGQRGGILPQLLAQLKTQHLTAIEVILSIGESPNGRARNLGAEAARGEFLVFIDDDATLGDDQMLERLVAPLKERSDVGLAGVSQLIPRDAKFFQRCCARQIPRAVSPVVDQLVDSDMVTTLCLAIRRDLFVRVGRMNDRLLAGVDPDLRHRVRQAGLRVVVVPHAWAYHPAPDTLGALVRYGYKKGHLTAWQYRFARDLMYDCPEGHVGDFAAQTTLPYRVLRKGARFLAQLLTLRPLGAIYEVSYLFGYLNGLVRRW